MSDEVCPTCGAKTVEYRHSLSRGLVRVLMAMADLGGSARTDELPLSRSDKDNAQKLRYWDLITHARKGEPWRLTSLAYEWLDGSVSLSRSVWTYRGERVRYEGKQVVVGDVLPGYQLREEWASEARPHVPASRRIVRTPSKRTLQQQAEAIGPIRKATKGNMTVVAGAKESSARPRRTRGASSRGTGHTSEERQRARERGRERRAAENSA